MAQTSDTSNLEGMNFVYKIDKLFQLVNLFKYVTNVLFIRGLGLV